MPTNPTSVSLNIIVEEQLNKHLHELEGELLADVLVFSGPIVDGADELIRDAIELRQQKQEKLALILETRGGYIEVAQRIADTLRQHYKYVEFIIPNFAMSAGTVLVMSGDAIHMDYFSVLGPIDPQVQRPGGNGMIPALGYLVQYERLIKKSKKGTLTTAELTFLVEKFDPAELYTYEQARELSITLLEEWLVKYKFKNWLRTRTRNQKVTDETRRKRASQIAKLLNKTDLWHSHSRGISMAVLRETLKLEIEDFGEKQQLNEKIRAYYKLLKDYLMKLGHNIVVHSHKQFISLP